MLNPMARVVEKPGMMYTFKQFHERPYRGPVVPKHGAGTPQGHAAGQDGAEGGTLFLPSRQQQTMISPPSVASYSIEAKLGYRRAFVVWG